MPVCSRSQLSTYEECRLQYKLCSLDKMSQGKEIRRLEPIAGVDVNTILLIVITMW